MKCHAHPDASASGQCNGCQVALCHECVDVYQPPLCPSCAATHNRDVMQQHYFFLMKTAAFVALGIFLATALPYQNVQQTALLGVMPTVVFWGWEFLTEKGFVFHRDDYQLFYFVYCCIKFMVAAHVGFVAGPLKLYRLYQDWKTIHGT